MSLNNIAVFSRDMNAGTLSFVEMKQDGVGGINDLATVGDGAFSSDGKFFYVTASWDNAVTVFSRDPATGKLSLVESHKNGVNGVSKLGGAMGPVVSPDGKHLIVAAFDPGSVVLFTRDTVTGRLTFKQYIENGGEVDGLGWANSIAISADGRHIYISGYMDSAVTWFLL
jgi:6-phosphogluconolactonase (cycloisomerase 2 family)